MLGRAAFGVVLFCAATSTNALAEEAKPEIAEGVKPEIAFSADELQGDLRQGELVLRGHVVVTYDRFRLTSPELSLARTPRGIAVRGWGELVFCPCPDPPVTVGFGGGLVAPAADLMLERPELRVAGTTLLVLPWFWLRAPSRPGLLPPTVAWRGADGLLIGAGLHLPWSAADGGALHELDVTAAAYVQGGFELGAKLRTPGSTNRVRWDRLHGDLLAVDAHGSHPEIDTGALAWDIDAVRGPRARSAALTLEEAARAYDRAAGEATIRPAPSALAGIGVRAVAARGGSGPSERGAGGPRAAVSGGGALGAIGAWDVLATFTVLDDPWLGSTQLGRVDGSIDAYARPSFLLMRLGLRQSTAAAAESTTTSIDALGVGEVEIAAPLVRTFATDDAPLVHIVEPRARASLTAARTSGAYWSATGRPVALGAGEVALASLGVRTTWGRLLGRSGGALDVDVGEATVMEGAALSAPATVVRYRTSWSTRYLGWAGEGAARLSAPRGQVVVGRVRVGEEEGWHLGIKAAGRDGVEPLLARAIAPASAEEPSGGWLSDEGWSAGTDLRAKLGRAVHATVSVDEDLTSETLLAARGSVGYTHSCRCLAVDAFASRRLGRGGFDVWLSIDLAPR